MIFIFVFKKCQNSFPWDPPLWVHLLITLNKLIMVYFVVWNLYFTFLYQWSITLIYNHTYPHWPSSKKRKNFQKSYLNRDFLDDCFWLNTSSFSYLDQLRFSWMFASVKVLSILNIFCLWKFIDVLQRSLS